MQIDSFNIFLCKIYFSDILLVMWEKFLHFGGIFKGEILTVFASK